MIVAGFLVREVGVRHPQVLQVLGADVECHQAVLCFEGKPRILPKLPKKEVACEILEEERMLNWNVLVKYQLITYSYNDNVHDKI